MTNDPNALMELSKCYDKCIPDGFKELVIIYLWNRLSGMNLTPQQLMDNAACFKCIPRGIQNQVQTYLLSTIS